MVDPQELPEHVERQEDGLACRHCHGIVGDDGYALTLDIAPDAEGEPVEEVAEPVTDDAAFAEAVGSRGMA